MYLSYVSLRDQSCGQGQGFQKGQGIGPYAMTSYFKNSPVRVLVLKETLVKAKQQRQANEGQPDL